jgi:hypothetical protein
MRASKRGPRVTGWSKLFRDYIDLRGGERLHVVTEAELLVCVVLAGKRVNRDVRATIAHAMRALSWRRCGDGVYRRKTTRAATVATDAPTATTGVQS